MKRPTILFWLAIITFVFVGTAACNGGDDDDADTAGDADTDSDSDADSDADGDSDGDSDGDADGDSDGDSDGDADGDSDGDSDGDADGDSDGDSDGDADGDSDGDSDGDADGDSDTDTDADSDSDADGCGLHDNDRPADKSVENDDYCYNNINCKSGLCVSYMQTSPDPDGHCEAVTSPGKILAIGTTLDFETREVIPDATVKTFDATQMSLLGCNAQATATITSDADGRFKQSVNKPGITEQIGMIARATKGDDYALSASGVADTPWPAGFIRHDILMVKKATLAAWSEMLSEDTAMAPYMNLSAKGGAIGAILDVDCGKPIIGAEVRKAGGGNTNAKIRYLNADGTGFVTDGITESGIFVLVNPALAEKFDVFLGDEKVNITTATFGDTSCMIFIVDIPIEADEHGIEL